MPRRAVEVVDGFRDEEPAFFNQAARFLTRYSDKTGSGKAKTALETISHDLRSRVRGTGFEHLGAYYEGLWVGSPTLKVNCFVDPAREIRVSLFLDPKGYDAYTLWTYFEDGSCAVSWSRANPNTSSTRHLKSFGSTGSFENDLHRHRDFIDEKRADGTSPVNVRSMEDVKALFDYYYAYLLSSDRARAVVTILVAYLAVFGLIIYFGFQMF